MPHELVASVFPQSQTVRAQARSGTPSSADADGLVGWMLGAGRTLLQNYLPTAVMLHKTGLGTLCFASPLHRNSSIAQRSTVQ